MDVQPQEDKALYTLHPTMGLQLFSDFGSSGPVRGWHVIGTKLYVVHRGTLWEVDTAGQATSRGTLNTTSGKVDMRSNNQGTLIIADGTNSYIWEPTPSFNAVTDADYYDGTETVEYHDGYFINPTENTGEFQLSFADMDGTTASQTYSDGWTGTDVATAEKDPDALVRVFTNTTEILLCGEQTIEFWSNTGNVDFPYERVSGGVIELGLASKWAISRFAESSVMLLARNGTQGDVKVIRIDGFKYTEVASGAEFESEINTYTTISDASAFAYTKQGHPFWQLNFPTEGKSWLYDGKTRLWSELQYSSSGARHRAELGVAFNGKYYVSDYENGKIYELTEKDYSDNGEAVVREFTGRHIFDEVPVRISRLWLDMEVGTGTHTTDPQVMLQISKDGGRSYGNEKWRSLGKLGEYMTRIIWRRLGRAFDWVFKVRIVSTAKTVFIGSWVDTV